MLKPIKFTRESGCLAPDEFLVNSEGGHLLIYISVFFLLLGTVLQISVTVKHLIKKASLRC